MAAGLLDSDDPHQVHAFRLHSVDVRVGIEAGDYLAKQDDSRQWDFSHELAKSTSKAGRKKGVHPFHFLVRQNCGDDELFVAYVDAMKGRRQLFWSPGLKARVQVEDTTDQELAEELREPADCLGRLSLDDWKLIRGNDAHAEVLAAAECGGWLAVARFVQGLTMN